MSIEMDNPETLLEKVDALTNLVEQMLLAHRMRDEQRFNESHDKAAQLGFEVMEALQESESGLTQRAADLCQACGSSLVSGTTPKNGKQSCPVCGTSR